MLKRLWLDEGGAILSVELILIMVMLVIGLVVGLKAVRDTVDAKLVELSAAILAIDTGYGFGGIEYESAIGTSATGDGAWVAGSAYNDTTILSPAGPADVLFSEVLVAGDYPTITSL